MNVDHEEKWLNVAVGVLREDAPCDPEAEERLMSRIRAEAVRTLPAAGAVHGRTWWNWLLRPRRIALSPLAAAGLALVSVLLLVAGARIASERNARRDLGAGVAPSPQEEGHAVLFTLLAPKAAHVNVVGDFNNWDPQRTPLERRGAGGVWAGVVMLPAGVYSYSFVVDGRPEIASDERPVLPAGDFGVGSSVVVVTEGST